MPGPIPPPDGARDLEPGGPRFSTEPLDFVPAPSEAAEWAAWANALPVSRALGLVCTAASPGHMTFELGGSVLPLNPNGSVHGGLVLGAADHVMGATVFTAMEPGQICATATLNGSFHRPALAPLRYEAEVERSGRSIAYVNCAVYEAGGAICHRATGAWSVNRTPPRGA